MPAVLLIRHGQASFGTADYDVLSETGVLQAAAVHAALAERGIAVDRLVSGSLRRQLDTLKPWTDAGAEVSVDARWDEYDSEDVLGAHATVPASPERHDGDAAPPMTSRRFQEVIDPALRAWVEAGADGPAAETWPMFRERVTEALRDLIASLRSGETAAVSTSGGPIGALCAQLLGVPDTALVAFNRVTINAAITKLVSGRGGTTLVSFNEHAHLEPAGLVTYR
jgi:broad specificity phosphatase PhoE